MALTNMHSIGILSDLCIMVHYMSSSWCVIIVIALNTVPPGTGASEEVSRQG